MQEMREMTTEETQALYRKLGTAIDTVFKEAHVEACIVLVVMGESFGAVLTDGDAGTLQEAATFLEEQLIRPPDDEWKESRR